MPRTKRWTTGRNQGTAVPARRGAERQPGQDLGFGHRPPDCPLQRFGQLVQRLGSGEFLVQPVHDLVAGQRVVERQRPVSRGALRSAPVPRASDTPRARRRRSRLLLHLHREDATVEDCSRGLGGCRRDGARRRPDLGLVVPLPRWLPASAATPNIRAAKLRAVSGSPPVHDGRGRGDRRWCDPHRRCRTRAGGGSGRRFPPPMAPVKVCASSNTRKSSRASANSSTSCWRVSKQFELLDVGQENPRLPACGAHHLTRADLLRGVDRFAAARPPRLFEPRFIVRARRPRGAGRTPRHLRLTLRRLAHVYPEWNPRPGQESAASA